jgi:hypothetical protein
VFYSRTHDHLALSALLISMCRDKRKLASSKFANWALWLCHIGVLAMANSIKEAINNHETKTNIY